MDYFIWLTLLQTDTIRILTPIVILLIIGTAVYYYYFKHKMLNLFLKDKVFISKVKECKTEEEKNNLIYQFLIKNLGSEVKKNGIF